MLEETLQITRLMWSDRNGEEYKGKHYHLKETMCHPQPVQRYPPILIGGMGPKKTLKFVAKYADACNFFVGYGKEGFENAFKVLKNHCEDLGRPYEEIEKTSLASAFLDQPSVPDKTQSGNKNLKTVEDIQEALICTVPGIKYGVAFCEASGPRLIRYAGNDEALIS